MITDHKKLTPVEYRGIFVKREDLYKPFETSGVNGTKLRECYCLLEANEPLLKNGILTGCSIHSPQAPIVAALAAHFGVPSTTFYGGTSYDRIKDLPMVKSVTSQKGMTIDLSSPTGRQNVLQSLITTRASQTGEFIVRYGIDIMDRGILFDAVSRQCENIPKSVNTLIVTCGSGITTIGILQGLDQYRKDNIKKIILVGTAPNRLAKINKFFNHGLFGTNPFLKRIKYVDLFNSKGFAYEKQQYEELDEIVFHPNYEAKTYNWLKSSEYNNKDTLFWVVGGPF